MSSNENNILKKASDVWQNLFDRPALIAGPCSAESEKQVLDIAGYLSAFPQVKMFRAGIWKPRTRPNCFEGIGEIGLKWLRKVKERTSLLTMTEVIRPGHVEKCLKEGVDILWVGARTTVNPFLVTELAESLRGVDIPLFIKNPINPDIGLWIGAVERFKKAGISQIGLIHRGFSYYGNTRFRNKPIWNLPINMKCEFPDLPLICDPSHICGKAKDLMFPTAQKAFELNMQGLMLETHIDPNRALSDADQQLNPDEFKNLVESFMLLNSKNDKDCSNHFLLNDLEKLRQKITSIDEKIIEDLGDRKNLVEEIKKIKKELSIPNLQVDYWNLCLKEKIQFAKNYDLDDVFVKSLFETIHNESIRLQSDKNI